MQIGAHESVAGGLELAFGRAVEHRARALQIFTKTARGWQAPPLSEQTRKAYRAEARRTGLRSMAHGSYLLNLASEDPGIRTRSLECLADELTRAERLGLEFYVIHPGSHPDAAKGLRLIAQALDEVHAQTRGFRVKTTLETTAGQGNCLGWRFEHLAELFQQVSRPGRLSVCLDTCHLFAAGYDLSTERGYHQVMEELDHHVGLEHVGCFHLNDCQKPLGCRVDRHAEIGQGTLGMTAFRCLVNDLRFDRALGVLETPVPERYGEAIALLNSLLRRQRHKT